MDVDLEKQALPSAGAGEPETPRPTHLNTQLPSYPPAVLTPDTATTSSPLPRSSHSETEFMHNKPGGQGRCGVRVQECSPWPSIEQLKQKAKADKKARSCRWNVFVRMNKKQRVAFSILIFLLVVGLGVGLGVGLSRALHTNVFVGSGTSKPIPGK